MTELCLILFLAVVVLWFFTNEYPTLSGVYLSARAVRRLHFKVIVSLLLIGAVFLGSTSGVRDTIAGHLAPSGMDCQSLIIVLLSSLIILAVLKRFSVTGSVVYAVLGAFEAWRIVEGYEPDFRMLLSFLAAPAFAFIISAVMCLILEKTLGRTHIHLISLSYYMRFAVIVGLALVAFALGFNWGGFLSAGASVITGSQSSVWIIIIALAVSLIGLSPFMRDESDASAGRYADFTIYAVLSVGYAVAVTLLFFSFDASTSLLGLKPVPLSVGSVVFASVVGVEAVKRSQLVERDDLAKEALAFLTAPLGSMVVAYLILHVSGNDEEHMVDFTVMSAAILVLITLVFSGYVLRYRRQREATERLVYIQQHQIYENSRALNDMELKVILSENQALHNSVEMKRQEVMNVALSIVEQKEYLQSLNEMVKRLAKSKDEEERDRLIAELSSSLSQRLSYDSDVDSQYFYAQAESLHEDFNAKLSENFPDLTQQ